MRFAVDEESRREAAWTFHVQDIGLAFRRFSLARETERERVRTERGREHAQRQSCEILLDGNSRTRWRPRRSARGAAGWTIARRSRFALPATAWRRWRRGGWRTAP